MTKTAEQESASHVDANDANERRTYLPPQLVKLPVDSRTANTGSQNGDDGVFFS